MKALIRIVLCYGLLTSALEGFGENITATLITPAGRILADEDAVLKVIISNGTSQAQHVLINPHLARELQLFWGTTPDDVKEQMVIEGSLDRPPPVAWEWVISWQNLLQPGQVRTWDLSGWGWPGFLRDATGQKALYAEVLVNTNTWIRSNTNQVLFSSMSYKDGDVLLHSGYLELVGFQPVTIYNQLIDGERFLFADDVRICGIATNSTPSLSVNTNTALMAISYAGTTNSPINYDLKSMIIIHYCPVKFEPITRSAP